MTIDQAREIRRALPPLVTFVTLFMDDDVAFVRAAIDRIAPDLLQFLGFSLADRKLTAHSIMRRE